MNGMLRPFDMALDSMTKRLQINKKITLGLDIFANILQPVGGASKSTIPLHGQITLDWHKLFAKYISKNESSPWSKGPES